MYGKFLVGIRYAFRSSRILLIVLISSKTSSPLIGFSQVGKETLKQTADFGSLFKI